MTQPRHMCLTHVAYHRLTDDCLADVVAHSYQHPAPFSRAAWNDYQQCVERALLDQLIRAHHKGVLMNSVLDYDPDGEPAPVPVPDDDLKQAA